MTTGSHGFLRFDDVASIEQSRPNTPQQEAWELLASLSPTPIGPRETQRITDWPRITQCIRNGTRFSITATRPESTISVGFDSATRSDGSYEIRGKRTESGRVLAIMPIEAHSLSDHRFSMCAPYPVRFQLITSSDDRAGTQRFWRIAISSFREVGPEDFLDNAWDKQFEKDVAGGRLDSLGNEALRDLRQGRCPDL